MYELEVHSILILSVILLINVNEKVPSKVRKENPSNQRIIQLSKHGNLEEPNGRYSNPISVVGD